MSCYGELNEFVGCGGDVAPVEVDCEAEGAEKFCLVKEVRGCTRTLCSVSVMLNFLGRITGIS